MLFPPSPMRGRHADAWSWHGRSQTAYGCVCQRGLGVGLPAPPRSRGRGVPQRHATTCRAPSLAADGYLCRTGVACDLERKAAYSSQGHEDRHNGALSAERAAHHTHTQQTAHAHEALCAAPYTPHGRSAHPRDESLYPHAGVRTHCASPRHNSARRRLLARDAHDHRGSTGVKLDPRGVISRNGNT